MSVSLLVCYFLTEIRQIWGYLYFWMRYLSEIFLRHSWDIGSLVFALLGRAYVLTFEFLCADLNFKTSNLVTFWLSGGQLLRPSVFFIPDKPPKNFRKIYYPVQEKYLYWPNFGKKVSQVTD